MEAEIGVRQHKPQSTYSYQKLEEACSGFSSRVLGQKQRTLISDDFAPWPLEL